MLSRLTKAFTGSLAGAAFATGLILLAPPAEAQRMGPFAVLQGSWSGGGTITLNTGSKERIRCRGRYDVSDQGNTVQQSLRCASDSYRFDLSASVTHRGGSISGNFSESGRGVGGRLNGRASGGQIRALAEGSGFSATLTVNTHGDRQTVIISSPGSEISEISVSLRRR